MANCSKCGAPLREGAKFCGACGAKVEVRRFCTECGEELEPGEKFCPQCGTPAESKEADPSYFEVDDYLGGDGCFISRYTGPREEEDTMVIPSRIGGKKVKGIGIYAFCSCSHLVNITIPDSVRSIGACAFSGCTNLTSITIPDSVTRIDDRAFSECTNLTSITIPDSVTEIDKCAFSRCPSLTIHAPAGSIAERYAAENHIPFQPL